MWHPTSPRVESWYTNSQLRTPHPPYTRQRWTRRTAHWRSACRRWGLGIGGRGPGADRATTPAFGRAWRVTGAASLWRSCGDSGSALRRGGPPRSGLLRLRRTWIADTGCTSLYVTESQGGRCARRVAFRSAAHFGRPNNVRQGSPQNMRLPMRSLQNGPVSGAEQSLSLTQG